jgi:hypothetical protein
MTVKSGMSKSASDTLRYPVLKEKIGGRAMTAKEDEKHMVSSHKGQAYRWKESGKFDPRLEVEEFAYGSGNQFRSL